MKECIIILGMHRSGTSVLAGLVSILGYYTGCDLMKPTQDNPKGYYEHQQIFLLNETILREQKTRWDDDNFMATDISQTDYQRYVLAAKTVIESELKYVNKIIIKDPRISLLFPIWEQALIELGIQIKTLFIYRNPLEVAYSLKQRDGMPLEKGLMLWSHYFFQAECYNRKYSSAIIKYHDDFTSIRHFINKLGALLNVNVTDTQINAAKEFYSPSLKHHHLGASNMSNDVPDYLRTLAKHIETKKLNKTLIYQLKTRFKHDKSYYLHNEKKLHDIITEYKQSTTELNQALAASKNKLTTTKEQLNHTEQELSHTKKKLSDTKRLLNDTKRQLGDTEKKNKKDTQQQQVLQEKINLLKKQAEIGNEILTTTLTNNKIKNRLKKTISIGRLPLNVKKWLCFSQKKSCYTIARQRQLIIQSGLFSPYYYLTSYPDVWQAKSDPLEHFCRFGWKEGRKPSHYFNTIAYLRTYSDVAQANINPLIHYITDGKKEGRSADPDKKSSPAPRHHIKKIQPVDANTEHLFGPIFQNRWKENSPLIQLLTNNKKTLEQDLPNNIKNAALKQTKTSALTVSIIMPTWNREQVICLAINSVMKQTFSSYELIIADDGSTDNTLSLIKTTYAEEIKQGLITLIENTHQGVSACRNTALEKASGDIIAYLDSDNVWREHYLLLMVAAFAENDELNCAYSALKGVDKDRERTFIRSTPYNRKQLLQANFIDLNIFAHKKTLFEQFGGFDTQLKRLVDWELIIRYTKNYEPAYLPFIGVDYYIDHEKFNNISTSISLEDNRQRVYDTHFQERVRYGLTPLMIAYVLWDYPALSQTFVLLEIKELLKQGYDVKVYYSIQPDKPAILDFDVASTQVKDADDLAHHLINDQRNLCHSHFAYPAVTLLTYPACIKTNIPFTFMPHAVDIFHRDNKARNKIAEITQHALCLKVFVHGTFHKHFIESCGVPSQKIAFNFQAVNVADFTKPNQQTKKLSTPHNKPYTGIVVTRFVEKKGIASLIKTANFLKNENIIFEIYGYGPLENSYKEQIKQLSLDNVKLKGELATQHDVAIAYQSADFLIAPCIIADNGDMDGFPTVILEAMAMELPVITTDIAAIPDYLTDNKEAFIETANQPEAMAARILQLKAMPAEQKQTLIDNAKDFLDKKIGVTLTVQRLLDTWQNYHIEIFLVTYNTPEYEDRENTFEIIKRIFLFTTTPFTLTIIDNHSNADFWEALCTLVKGKPNVRLIRKQSNPYCGPSSTTALELSTSEYAIYLCSKEAFIKDHGWERTLIAHMRKHPEQMIAGHPSYVPKFIYGNEYTQFSDFKHFRNKNFAKSNPDKVFAHIQGGIYILRREFIAQHGSFNTAIPQGGMDIELSYYIESLGYPLGVIPEVISITTKTLPDITTRLNEKTVVAHPLTSQTVHTTLDDLNTALQGCNICHWKGEVFTKTAQLTLCPNCSSTAFDRSVMKYLAGNHHIYRKERCITLGISPALKKTFSSLFQLVSMEESAATFQHTLKTTKSPIDYLIVDYDLVDKQQQLELWQEMTNKLSKKGEILFTYRHFESLPKTIKNSDALNQTHHFSQYCQYDWRKLVQYSPNMTPLVE